MHYDSFIDYIISQGCAWQRYSTGRLGHLYFNQGSGKAAYIIEEAIVPKRFIVLFCEEIGIDVPEEVLS